MKTQRQYDTDFLKKLDEFKHKVVYARIELLTFDELPIESIEGKITGGSINIDGTSAVRRSCSLTMATNEKLYKQYSWGLNSKFSLAIGLENKIDNKYPDIIWFNQGIYLITSFNTSQSASSYNISIQGKDKMCLLNGDLGGALPASVDFGQEEVITYSYNKQNNITKDNYIKGKYCYIVNSEEEAKKHNIYYISTQNKQTTYYVLDEEEFSNKEYYLRESYLNLISIPIQTIIKKLLTVYGKEKESNIIINDLDQYGYELLANKCDETMYFFKDAQTNRIVNASIGTMPTLLDINNNKITDMSSIKFDNLDSNKLLDDVSEPTKVRLVNNGTIYTIISRTTNETVGYRICDLVYAGELITSVGENITSVLDKIKNMLSCFEYYYDIDGRFIFQRKKFYEYQSWNNIVKNSNGDNYIEPAVYSSSSIYSFRDGQTVISFNNTPQITNLRNDFSIWGQRESASGAEIPIHLRYAIDQKPIQYTTIIVNDNDINRYKFTMYNNDIFDTMNPQLEQKTYKNKWYQSENEPGVIYCDWREVLYRMAVDYYQYNYADDFTSKVATANPDFYPSGITGYETYYVDLFSFWRDIYDYDKLDFKEEVKNNPENLNFWFDFIGEENADIAKYSVQLIGDRTKAINDTNIKVICYRDTPDVLFMTQTDYDSIIQNNYPTESGYIWINIPSGYDNYFKISSKGKSAVDEIEDLLYTTAYCTESVSISTIPVYYLEPNNRIYIEDKRSGVEGEYLVNKITIPLTYNGSMSISATKAISRVY